MNKKNILLLSKNNDFHTQIDKVNENKDDIIHMYHSKDMLKFYELLKEDIDMVIIDEEIKDIDLVEYIKREKTTIYIKLPIKDELITKILKGINEL